MNILDNLITQLPLFTDDKLFVINKENLREAENIIIEIDNIIITKKWHYYNDSFRIEGLDISTDKHSYCTLGLLILNSLFYRKQIKVYINNPNSQIKYIHIGCDFNYAEKRFGLMTDIYAYNYWATDIRHRYPLIDQKEFAKFELINHDGKPCYTDEDWASRNCLQISGSEDLMSTVGELLLNIGNLQNTVDEVSLECNVGYGGVAPGSVEINFWLPGSIGFNEDVTLRP